MIIISGNSHSNLTQEIGNILRVGIGRSICQKFSDGETSVQIIDNIRGQSVYIVQTFNSPVNDNLIELCLLADAARREGAKTITAIMPYFGYARKERKSNPGEPISAKLVLDLLVTSGVDEFVSCDLHSSSITGFTTKPFEELSVLGILADSVRREINNNCVVVAPDVGSVKRARNLASLLDLPVGFMEKERDVCQADSAKLLSANIGQGYSHAIIVDDLISTGSTLVQAANYLKSQGYNRIDVCVSHILCSVNHFDNLMRSPIDRVYATNTVPINYSNPRLKVVSVAQLISRVISHLDG